MRLPLETAYLAGPGDVSLVWADGTTTMLPEWSVVRLERRPRRISGKLSPLHSDGGLGYEAPERAPYSILRRTPQMTTTHPQPQPPDPQPIPPQGPEPEPEPEPEDEDQPKA